MVIPCDTGFQNSNLRARRHPVKTQPDAKLGAILTAKRHHISQP